MSILRYKDIGWWVSVIAITLMLLSIGFFGYMKTRHLIQGVDIKTELSRRENSSLLRIKGNAMNAIHLKLNGREIYIDKEGNFSEMVDLLPGLSVIKLNAVDRFGKETEKEFKIINKNSA